MRSFLLALQYFTRIPLPGPLAQWVGFAPQQLASALGYLPLVGLMVGGACALIAAAALALLPDVQLVPAVAWVAALLALAAGLLITGGFHEDGLADLADGLGGSYDAARALEIMKDSRLGAFGAMALCVALLLKVALLAAIVQAAPAGQGAAWLAAALIGGHVFSRLAPLGIVWWLPHVAQAESKSKAVAQSLSRSAWALALFTAAVVWLGLAFALPDLRWWPALPGAALGGALIGWRLKKRLQGYTGDGLGAAQQLGELGVYLALIAA